jgi:hypothetical protein
MPQDIGPGQAMFSEAYETKTMLPLGQQLLRAGLLTQAQLAQALREQQQTHLKFGEICLERGWVAPEDLYRFMGSQCLGLGELLVMRGALKFDQLRIALSQQRRFGRKLGEILLWRGWIQPELLEEVLQQQRQLHSEAKDDAWQALASFRSQKQGDTDAVLAEFDWQREADNQDEIKTQWLEDSILKESNQVADLKLKLELQQKEWDLFLIETQQQVNQFQHQYQERIAQLEEQILRLQREKDTLQNKHQEKVLQLLQELEHQKLARSRTEKALEEYYQKQIDVLEEKSRLDSQSFRELKQRVQELTDALRQSHALQQQQRQKIKEQGQQLAAAAQKISSLTLLKDKTGDPAKVTSLTMQLRNAHELLSAYRSSLKTIQQELQDQQAQNRLLQVKLSRMEDSARSSFSEAENRRFQPAWAFRKLDLTHLTPWARQLMTQLRESNLISEETLQKVLSTWIQQGGKLTQILENEAGLSPSTIHFFGDQGFSARLHGCQHLGDFLQAAGLITQEDLTTLLENKDPNQSIEEALVEKELIPSPTVEYFSHLLQEIA